MTKRKKKSGGSSLFCGCIGKRDEVPPIEHNIVLQQVTTNQPRPPMPSQEELKTKFGEFVVSGVCYYFVYLFYCYFVSPISSFGDKQYILHTGGGGTLGSGA